MGMPADEASEYFEAYEEKAEAAAKRRAHAEEVEAAKATEVAAEESAKE
jgi:hypothetical protein